MRFPRRGFTLVELVIALAIIAILASVAMPSFLAQMRKSRRADAVVTISQLQQAQERWRANNSTYGTLTDLGLPNTSTSGYYTLAMTNPTQTGYVVTATAVTGKSQASDAGCSTLTVTVYNGTAVNAPSDCWSK